MARLYDKSPPRMDDSMSSSIIYHPSPLSHSQLEASSYYPSPSLNHHPSPAVKACNSLSARLNNLQQQMDDEFTDVSNLKFSNYSSKVWPVSPQSRRQEDRVADLRNQINRVQENLQQHSQSRLEFELSSSRLVLAVQHSAQLDLAQERKATHDITVALQDYVQDSLRALKDDINNQRQHSLSQIQLEASPGGGPMEPTSAADVLRMQMEAVRIELAREIESRRANDLSVAATLKEEVKQVMNMIVDTRVKRSELEAKYTALVDEDIIRLSNDLERERETYRQLISSQRQEVSNEIQAALEVLNNERNIAADSDEKLLEEIQMEIDSTMELIRGANHVTAEGKQMILAQVNSLELKLKNELKNERMEREKQHSIILSVLQNLAEK